MASIVLKGRLSYPALFEAKLNKLSGNHEYSTVLLLDETSVKKAEKAVLEAAQEKWGQDQSKWPKNLRTPVRDQGEREKELDGKMVLPNGYVKGEKYVNLKSKQKPGVVDKDVQPVLDSSAIYAGAICNVSVSVFAYDKAGNRGVSFGLNNVQKVADGETLGGRLKAEDEFAPVAVAETKSDMSAEGMFA